MNQVKLNNASGMGTTHPIYNYGSGQIVIVLNGEKLPIDHKLIECPYYTDNMPTDTPQKFVLVKHRETRSKTFYWIMFFNKNGMLTPLQLKSNYNPKIDTSHVLDKEGTFAVVGHTQRYELRTHLQCLFGMDTKLYYISAYGFMTEVY